MADTGRQSMTDKAGAALKPDSQKGTGEQVGDSLKGTGDSIASTLQPQSDKSATQKAGDTVSGNSNKNDKSMLDSAKDTLGMNK
ncbi:heat shock protein 9/12-domain-containing protein [Mycena filopes]|nr:heat shock protein 9/12-domain-containing protein [Mycena filopes]